MPATKEKPIKRTDPIVSATSISKLGIIAGGGQLPHRLLQACLEKNIEPFIIAFDGETDPELVKGHNHFWGRLGAAGQIIKTLEAHNVRDLVLIGSLRRPSFFDLKPDLKTASFFARVGMRAMGDNDLLVSVKGELENEGFVIHSIQDFVEDLLAPAGILGRAKPSKKNRIDIDRGIEACLGIGALDIGQSVIVQEGIVLGVEGVEGTDALIRRCKDLKRKGSGGVLVKLCKPGQDKSLDLPTIGVQTIRLCLESGLDGVVIDAGQSLLIDAQDVVKLADQNKMFIMGYERNR